MKEAIQVGEAEVTFCCCLKLNLCFIFCFLMDENLKSMNS